MGKKKLGVQKVIFVVLLFFIVLTSCESSTSYISSEVSEGRDTILETSETKSGNDFSEGHFKFTDMVFGSDSIKISYPQVDNMYDANKKKKVNELIKNEAVKVLNYYGSDTTDQKNHRNIKRS